MRGQGGGLAGAAGLAGPAGAAGPAGPTVSAALERALETADAAEVLSECLHAWAADFLRSLRLHEESSGSAQTAPAAAEAVRRLRRASRRIGSALLTYRSLVDAAWADELSGELRRLSGTLAREYRCAARQARLLAALHRLAVEGVGGDRAAALLERQHSLARSRAHSAALETLVSSRFHAVADSVAVLAYEVPLAPDGARGRRARDVLVPPAERARETLVRAVGALPAPRAAGHGPQGGGDTGWLEVRILLRHHRYAQEVLYAAVAPPVAQSVAPSAAPPVALPGAALPGAGEAGPEQPCPAPSAGGPDGSPDPRLATAGTALDRHRDAVEAAEAAAAAARTPRIAPATAYALGVLHAGQRQEAEAALREFAELWNRAPAESREAQPQVL